MTNEEKWNLLSKLIADAIGVGETLKNEDYDYKIDITKSNEKISEDGVKEYNININLYVSPKRKLEFIQNTFTILKTGTIFTK